MKRETLHRFCTGGAQADGSHSIAKVEEEAVDHRVVNGDDLLRSVRRATFGTRKGDHARAAAE